MTNYFGLVLSFMVPGIVIGLLAAGAAREIAENRRTKAVRTSPQRSLYIEDLRKEEMRSGQKKKLTEAASKPAGENAFVILPCKIKTARKGKKMSLVVKGIEQINEGTYVAVCSGVIDLGSQYNEFYKKNREEVLIVWTLPYEQVDAGNGEMQPRQVSNNYSATISGSSRLRAALEGWRGKAFTSDELKSFDLRNILGAPCLVTVKRIVSKAGREYTSVDSVAPLPKGTQLPALEAEPLLYDLSEDWAFEEMRKLPAWIQNRIKTSQQYKAFENGAEVPGEPHFDAPMPWDE